MCACICGWVYECCVFLVFCAFVRARAWVKTAALSCCSQPQPNTYKALVSMCVRACVRVMLGVCVCLCAMYIVCACIARVRNSCVRCCLLPQNHHTGDCRPCQWRIRGPRGIILCVHLLRCAYIACVRFCLRLPQNHHIGDCRPCQWRIRGPRGTPESAAVDAGAAHAIDQVP